MIKQLVCAVFILMMAGTTFAVDASLRLHNPDEFIDALILKENSYLDRHRIGDRHLFYRAHGLLQIRKPYLDDVNRIVGKTMMKKMWGVKYFTITDIKDAAKARWVVKIYLVHYGKEYTADTGKYPTPEVYARIHNGGPEGWKKRTTKSYWQDVKRIMVEEYIFPLVINNPVVAGSRLL